MLEIVTSKFAPFPVWRWLPPLPLPVLRMSCVRTKPKIWSLSKVPLSLNYRKLCLSVCEKDIYGSMNDMVMFRWLTIDDATIHFRLYSQLSKRMWTPLAWRNWFPCQIILLSTLWGSAILVHCDQKIIYSRFSERTNTKVCTWHAGVFHVKQPIDDLEFGFNWRDWCHFPPMVIFTRSSQRIIFPCSALAQQRL